MGAVGRFPYECATGAKLQRDNLLERAGCLIFEGRKRKWMRWRTHAKLLARVDNYEATWQAQGVAPMMREVEVFKDRFWRRVARDERAVRRAESDGRRAKLSARFISMQGCLVGGPAMAYGIQFPGASTLLVEQAG